MYTNAQIYPQFSGSSARTDECNPEDKENYRITPEELTKIALGRRFTLGNGYDVNRTYDEWLTNLFYLMKHQCICKNMKEGLIKLNPSGRSKDEKNPDSSDGSNGSASGSNNCHYWCAGYPPFAIY